MGQRGLRNGGICPRGGAANLHPATGKNSHKDIPRPTRDIESPQKWIRDAEQDEVV